MEQLAVECIGVEKSYYNGQTVTPALRGIDLSIKQGELFMLVGPSGCGKTTLISVIAGILLQDQGKVLVMDHDLKQMSDRKRTVYRGNSLGFVFQSYNLIPTLSVWENVSVPLLLNGGNLKDAKEKCFHMLSQVGLAGKEEVRPSQLSGGQQQRVAIARALIHEPKVVVCDEPTSALDKDTGQRIMELFRNVALANGRTLIIVSHDNRIFRFADRVAVMSDGKIESISTPDKLAH
jgi:putative ABC transport system ATP-binding protein